MKTARAFLITAVLCSAWIGSIALGMHLSQKSDATPTTHPLRFPDASALTRATDRATLIVITDASCPATPANLDELTRVLSEVQGQVKTYVLFAPAGESGAQWGGLWSAVASMPGVVAVGDNDGIETRRFGAAATGHALLFNTHGRLVFSGGLTEARNRMGESAIVALVKDSSPMQTTSLTRSFPGLAMAEPQTLAAR